MRDRRGGKTTSADEHFFWIHVEEIRKTEQINLLRVYNDKYRANKMREHGVERPSIYTIRVKFRHVRDASPAHIITHIT